MSSPRKRRPRPSPVAAPPAAGPEAADVDALFSRIVTILEDARARAVRAINTEMVLAYWHIGREIVHGVQGGEQRAGYGEAVLEKLSAALTRRFGRGFSRSNLGYFRQFYLAFADRGPELRPPATVPGKRLGDGTAIHQTAFGKSVAALPPGAQLPTLKGFSPALSWSHYRMLAKVDDPAARQFYEIEAEREGWTWQTLQRQIHTQLFGRLRKSRDPAGILDLARRGQSVQRPVDTIRDPYVLDFLDLPDSVRLFDDRYTTEGDNPTIGLILCAEKNEAVARYSVLHGSEQLFATRYVTYLPTAEELQRELLRERQLLEARRDTEAG